MALTTAELENLNNRIGWLLDKHLAPIFKDGVKLTFIARTPGNDEADVLVTSERDLNEVVALVLRSLGRAAIGAGTSIVARTAGSEAEAAGTAGGADRLHAAIMNIPCRPGLAMANATEAQLIAYKLGHRDARHAAAELVAASAQGEQK